MKEYYGTLHGIKHLNCYTPLHVHKQLATRLRFKLDYRNTDAILAYKKKRLQNIFNAAAYVLFYIHYTVLKISQELELQLLQLN